MEEHEAQNNKRVTRQTKRSKTAAEVPSDTFILRVPTLAARTSHLERIMEKLKDVMLPTKSKFGYIVSLFGGIPHLSYPPTADELVLYSHVVHLHELCRSDKAAALATLSHTLNSLRAPQLSTLEPLDLDLEPLFAMFACVWNDCNQSATLLSLLKPFLSRREDHVRIGELLGPTISLNIDSFLDFCAYRADEAAISIRRSSERRVDKVQSAFKNQLEKRYPGYSYDAPSPGYVDEGHYWQPTNLKPNDAVPPTHIAFVSSLPSTSSTTSTTAHPKILASSEVIYLRWPYMKKKMDSQRPKSHSRIFELPLSTNAIIEVLKAIHYLTSPTMTHSTMMELFQKGVQIGLYNSMRLNNHVPNLVDGTDDYFDSTMPYFNSLVAIMASVKGSARPPVQQ